MAKPGTGKSTLLAKVSPTQKERCDRAGVGCTAPFDIESRFD